MALLMSHFNAPTNKRKRLDKIVDASPDHFAATASQYVLVSSNALDLLKEALASKLTFDEMRKLEVELSYLK